jgi:hypothetical protein
MLKGLATKFGPMICKCSAFSCFDHGHYLIGRESAAFRNATGWADLASAKREWTRSGFVLAPTWWWREPVGVNPAGYFGIVVHKNN